MSVFNVSFIERPQLRAGHVAAVLVAGLLLGVAVHQHVHWSDEASHWKRQRQAVANRSAVNSASQELPAVSADRARAINGAIAELNVPWPALLAAVESAKPAGTSLLRLEPRPQDAVLRVTAETSDIQDLIGFARGLSSAQPFVGSAPVQQERIEADGRVAARATFEVRWRRHP